MTSLTNRSVYKTFLQTCISFIGLLIRDNCAQSEFDLVGIYGNDSVVTVDEPPAETFILSMVNQREQHAVYVTPTVLTACLIIERGISDIYDYDRSAAAIDLGVRYVNEYLLSPQFVLQTVYTDIGNICSKKSHIIAHLMDLKERKVKCDVYIGPGCGAAAEAIYSFIEYFDTPVIACPAADLGGADSLISDYPYLNRYQNYTTPVFLQDDSTELFAKMNAIIMETIKAHYWSLYYSSKFVPFGGNVVTKDSITHMLNEAKETSRVIILLANARTVRKIMIAASALGMTQGDYVFITIELFESRVWGSYTWQKNDIYDPIAKEAYRVLLLFSLKKPTDDLVVNFWSDVVHLSMMKYNYTMAANKIDPIVTHFFDAITLYGNVVKDLSVSGRSYRSARIVGKYTNNYTFYSPVNGDVYLSTDSDRLWYYVLSNLDKDTYRFEDFLGFPPKSVKVDIMGTHFDDWPDGAHKLPQNTPFCGFRGENPECHVDEELDSEYLIADIAAPIFILLAAGTAVVVTLKRVRQLQSNSVATWRIYHHEVDGLDTESLTTTLSLEPVLDTIEADSITRSTEVEAPFGTAAKHASFRGNNVDVRRLGMPLHSLTYSLQKDVYDIKGIQHPNLQKFIGLVVDLSNRCEYVIGEYCSRGCLDDLIQDSKLDLDFEFKQSLTRDLANGLWFLHTTVIKSHGHLSSFTCLIDSRFSLKISQFGLPSLVNTKLLEPPTDGLNEEQHGYYLWRAPELLRSRMPVSGTQKGDVYSFAILLQQIVLQSQPFQFSETVYKGKSSTVSPTKDIILEVKQGRNPPIRPPLPRSAASPEILNTIELCWQEDPRLRPAMTALKAFFEGPRGYHRSDKLLDHLVARMEKYAMELEQQVEDKAAQFMAEKERTAGILSNVLPRSIAMTLMAGGTVLPETFECVTVYFGDIPGFSDVVGQTVSTPREYLEILNTLSLDYDTVVQNRNVHEIEYLNVNGSSLIVSGLPVRNGNRHAQEIALLAVDLSKAIREFKVLGSRLLLRVGIHSGPCVAGIIGSKLPKYCVFGDTVNTASRMETTGKAGKIQCSIATKSFLDWEPGFVFIARDGIHVKGKGLMVTFWVEPLTKSTSGQKSTSEYSTEIVD